jgi:cell division protease FtsH
MTYGEEDEEVFLGRSVTQHKSVSDDTARRIDGEVRKVIDNAFLRAKEILVANMD